MYKFKYKRKFFYKSYNCKGHNYDKDWDRMDVFLANDEGVISIPKWSECTLKLDASFILFQKKEIEKEIQ